MNARSVLWLAVVGTGLGLTPLSAQEPKAAAVHAPRQCLTQAAIVRCVAFSPDGQTLAEGSKDRTIKLWDVATGKVRATLTWRLDWLAEQVAPLPKEEVGVAFSPDGRTLASENVDKTIHLWDVATGKVRATFNEGIRGD